jgi:Ca-activated chloride channel family protein
LPRVIIILLIAFFSLPGYSQYYLKGEVKDEHGNYLQNVSILVRSSEQVYRTGTYGDFGFMSSTARDTLYFSLDGYNSITSIIIDGSFLSVQMTSKPASENLKRNHLASFIKDYKEGLDDVKGNGESYSALVENPFVKTEHSPSAIFAPNTNKASYTNIRRFLNMNGTVPPDAVRIEEMLNYFNFHYQEPSPDNDFYCSSYITTTPWNKKTALLYLNICARKMDMANVPPSNLVFLIDVSGSMDLPNKLPLLKAGLRLLVNNLRDIDTISILTYGAQISVMLEGVPGSDKKRILDVIQDMQPAGSTPGEAAIRLAYKIARKHLIKYGNNRIILATDGDFNVGLVKEKDLEEMVDNQKVTGVYLSCMGVGMGNYKDSKLSILAQKGHGNFSYIDNEKEAEKVFVTEWAQTLYSVADNVSISAEFNPEVIKSYRLIGFENKKTALRDTSSKIEGGEVASGQSLMALFELLPNDSSLSNDYVACLKINYSRPNDKSIHTIKYVCPNKIIPFAEADTTFRQAACVAMLGMKLRQSKFSSSISWKNIASISKNCFSTGNQVGNEYLSMVTKAYGIYKHRRRKNW